MLVSVFCLLNVVCVFVFTVLCLPVDCGCVVCVYTMTTLYQ